VAEVIHLGVEQVLAIHAAVFAAQGERELLVPGKT